MSLTLSSTVIPAVKNMYETIGVIIEKAASAAAGKDIPDSVYLDWRIAPDMHPFSTQLRFATEIPARGLSRLSGAALPTFAADETTFKEFSDRLKNAAAIVNGIDHNALDADPDGEIRVPMGPQEVTLNREVFANQWILPNLYFHVTSSYLIIRGLGVDIGKRDFLVGLARSFQSN